MQLDHYVVIKIAQMYLHNIWVSLGVDSMVFFRETVEIINKR